MEVKNRRMLHFFTPTKRLEVHKVALLEILLSCDTEGWWEETTVYRWQANEWFHTAKKAMNVDAMRKAGQGITN